MRVPGALLLVLFAAAARADDAPKPGSDSIADAKRDLAAIKAPGPQQDPSALPAMDMRELGPVPEAARPEAASPLSPEREPSLGPARKRTGTGNWLIDAMDKNTAAQGSRSKEKDEILKGDPELVRADEKGVRLEKDPFLLDDAPEADRPKAAPEAVYNPLDAFMGGWISARDHDLLLSPARGDGLSAPEGGKTRADLLPGIEVGPPPPAPDFALAPPEAILAGDPGAASNPYVAVMDTLVASPTRTFTAADLAGFAPADPQGALPGVSPPGVDPGPADASRSVIPEFAQPAGDDKYFPQLKKF
jgi:hypothetical protein